jgi:hypothetical protein
VPSGFGFGGELSIVQRPGENPGLGWPCAVRVGVWLGWTRELMFVEDDYLETRLPRQMFRMRILASVAGIFLWPVDCGLEPRAEE